MAWWSSSLVAWSMLDVFALALLLFMAEGGRMVKFEVRSGFYMIILSVAIFYLVWGVNEHLIRRQKRRATDLA